MYFPWLYIRKKTVLGVLNKHFSGSHVKMLTSFLFYLFISKHLLSLCGRNCTGL